MEIEQSDQGDVAVLHLKGRFDTDTSPVVEKHLLSVLEAGMNKVLLEFGDVSYLSSAGLRVLVLASKRAKSSGGRIALAGVRKESLDILTLFGFLPHMENFETLDAGLAAFSKSSIATT